MRSSSYKFVCTVLLCCLVFISSAEAQTSGEWFRQKHTQKKYLLEQIAALRAYTGYVRKGYTVVRDGLGIVRDITNGEFGLHELFITGLKKASPAVRNDVRIAETMAMELSIVRSFANLVKVKGLPPDRLAYLTKVRSKLRNECLNDLEELLLVVTSGKVEMGDAERLSRLEGIYQRLRDKADFVQDFSTKVFLLNSQQHRETRNVKQIGGFYAH